MDQVFSLFGLRTSGISGALTLTKTGTTARTATFPDAAITVAGQNVNNAFSDAQTINSPGTIGLDIVKAGTIGLRINSTTVIGSAQIVFANNSAQVAAVDVTSENLSFVGSTTAGKFLNFNIGPAFNNRLAIAGDTGQAVFSGSGVTVPNGSAAAPGIRLTSEAHGLYRIGATSVGVSIAGTLALTVAVGGEMTLAATSTASTTAGALQRETNQSKLYTFDNGIGGWVDKCIFSQYATVSQAGIVTDQSLASATARGTRTLPANFFKLGKVLRFRLCGRYTTDAAAGNATIQIKLGSTVFRTTGSIALDNSSTALPWEIEGEIVCQTTGGTGTVEGVAVWKHMITGATPNYDAENLGGTAAVTIDTTASQAFDVIWTATDAGTTLTCTCFRLWEVC